MTDTLLSFDHVSFSYGTTDVLDDISFEVAPGSACALVGPNGAGKTTILRLAIGLETAKKGHIRFEGQEVSAQTLRDRSFAKRLRQRMGFVFQDPECQLFCQTVDEEVAFGPRQMGLEEAEIARRVEDCLALFDLTELRDRAPWQLSGGEKRRCAIACVVSLAPRLLLMDEPTNDLDDRSRNRLISFLASYVAAGRSILVSTHERNLVEELRCATIQVG